MNPAIDKKMGMLVRAYCEEILDNYNAERNSVLKFKEFTLEPATITQNLWGCMQSNSSDYYYLIFECFLDEKEYTQKFSDENSDQESGEIIKLTFFIKQEVLGEGDDEKCSVFTKESNLYCSLLPFMLEFSERAWCPRVYLCRRDVLVLEDMREVGYIMYKNLLAFTEAEILSILRGLAVMHSSSIAYERFNSQIGDSFAYCLEETLLDPKCDWFRTGVDALFAVAKIHPKYTKPSELTFINLDLLNAMQSVPDMANPSLKYRNVLCHRSVWVGNVFLPLNDPDASAVFVDFKSTRYCPPIIDVLVVLFTNLNREERFKKDEFYLDFYYSEFVRNLEQNELCEDSAGISKKTFCQSYEEFHLFGLVLRGLLFTLLKVPPQFVDDHYKTIDRSQKMLAYMTDNEEFRSLMFEVLEDIIDHAMPESCPDGE
uniref:CHK domain-containing protein n=1 Tax=Glossina pallidipes TaxID=7398 RepID=A0A1A9ZPW1_GLOPL